MAQTVAEFIRALDELKATLPPMKVNRFADDPPPGFVRKGISLEGMEKGRKQREAYERKHGKTFYLPGEKRPDQPPQTGNGQG